ncbi:MAG: hypothetical protein JNK81_11360 [Anaerolineales bacterium]|nr:hypothetical protein [Anaerolineales bacterium]
MNDGSGLKYLLTDHLGSVVVITDDEGDLISQQRYLPFGGVRTIPNSPITNTDYGYTGQRNLDEDLGLMDYKARFYSPVLNRFIQPDTIIPSLYSPQTLNRFSYVGNNPINFNDPTGHIANNCGPDNIYCGGLAENDYYSRPAPSDNSGKVINPKDGRDDEVSNNGIVKALYDIPKSENSCPPNIPTCIPIYSGTMTTSQLDNFYAKEINLQSDINKWVVGLTVAGTILSGAGLVTANPIPVVIGLGLLVGATVLNREATDIGILANEISRASSAAGSSDNKSINTYVFQTTPNALPSFTFENSPFVFNAQSISTVIMLNGFGK